MASLEKLHDYLFFRDRRCFKELMEHSENIIELLNAEDIVRKCSNLDRTKGTRKFNLMGNRNPGPWTWSSRHEIDANKSNYLQIRDEILYGLSMIWDFFHVLISKEIEKVCPSLYNFCQLLCKQGGIFQMLVTCLRTDDHFIAFQAHKVFRKIVRAFSEIVVHGALSELILSCLSENKGMWTVLYTIEIVKEILSFKTIQENCDPRQEGLQGCLSNCDCTFKELILSTVNVESHVWDILHQYWPALSKLCLDGFFVSDENESEISRNRQSGKAMSQQILASFVSLGSILVQSCYHPTIYGQLKHSRVHFLTLLELGFVDTEENVTASTFHSVEQNCAETQNNASKNMKLGGHEFILSISFQEIVEKLVEIDKHESSLHLRRTIIQFFNNVVGVSQQNSHDFFQRQSRYGIPDHVASICSFLLTNIDKLFESLPKVSPDVYFGGQDFTNEDMEQGDLIYDRVLTRKVLLLVLKSALITLYVQKRSKSSNWKLLEDSIESWLNIVAKAMPESHERHPHVDDNDVVADSVVILFADQDDELVTALQYILQLYQELFLSEGLLPITQWTKKLRRCFSPHRFFLKFLHFFHYDHSLLLDFLISNETCFLLYFSSYLRHMANDWNGFVEIAEELHFSCAKSLQTAPGPEHRNMTTTSSDPLCVLTNKTLLLDTNQPVAFLDLGEKYSNDILFLDRETGMEWSSENDLNHLIKDLNHLSKESKEVDVSISNNSALLSIMNNYANLHSDDSEGHEGDSEDDEGDFNEMEDEEDNVDKVDRVCDDLVCKYHGRYMISNQEDCGDDGDDKDLDDDHDGDHGVEKDHHEDEDCDENHGVEEDHHEDCDENHGVEVDHHEDCDENHGVEEDHHEDEDCDEDHDCGEDHDEDHDVEEDHDEDHDCEEVHDEVHDGVEDTKVDHLCNSLSCLIRLRFSIERMASKQLFPYPIQALVRLIKYIESLYEGD